MSLRREVAPKGITFNANDFFISDKYATILTVISYPGAIFPGYLASMISGMSGVKIVAKHIPIAFAVLASLADELPNHPLSCSGCSCFLGNEPLR